MLLSPITGQPSTWFPYALPPRFRLSARWTRDSACFPHFERISTVSLIINILGISRFGEYLHALEAQGGIEPPIIVLLTLTLPLGDRVCAPNVHYQTFIPAPRIIRTAAMPRLPGLWGTHHRSFNPNCTCRELVDVEVMRPAVADGSTVVAEVKTTGFGLLKLVRLKMLNSSARN